MWVMVRMNWQHNTDSLKGLGVTTYSTTVEVTLLVVNRFSTQDYQQGIII